MLAPQRWAGGLLSGAVRGCLAPRSRAAWLQAAAGAGSASIICISPPAAAARESSLPEHRIAESRGFLLEEPLGSGHFGRVYRGRTKSSGQVGPAQHRRAHQGKLPRQLGAAAEPAASSSSCLASLRRLLTLRRAAARPAVPAALLLRPAVQLVAIKVIDLLPSQRRQLVYACRECQLMSRVQHPSIVRVVTFYAAQVQARPQVVELT